MPTEPRPVDLLIPGDEWPTAEPEEVGLDAVAVSAAMQHLASICCDQGIEQAMLVRGGRVVWQGPDVDNLHTVWSCTKSFASAAMGLLVDDGRVALDGRVSEVRPELAEHYCEVTLRQMAAFTSGYQGREGGDTVKWFEPGPPLHAPGENFHYSQASDEMAYVLTTAAGEPLREVFRRRIAEPISMDPDGWWWGDWGPVGGGPPVCGGSGSYERGMHITARQMARMGLLLTRRGRWGDRQLLSREWVEAATSPQVPNTIPPFDPDAWYTRLPGAYGLHNWTNGVTPDGRRMWPDAPPRTCAIQGNMNNICFCVPEWDLVLVRMGTDGRIDNDRYTEVFARLREVFI